MKRVLRYGIIVTLTVLSVLWAGQRAIHEYQEHVEWMLGTFPTIRVTAHMVYRGDRVVLRTVASALAERGVGIAPSELPCLFLMKQPGLPVGGAVPIDGGLVATVAHGVDDADVVTLVNKDGAWTGVVVWHDEGSDVALISVALGSAALAVPVLAAPQEREWVVSLGYPFAGVVPFAVDGYVVTHQPPWGTMTTCPVAQGYSGGPVYNSLGELVGITKKWGGKQQVANGQFSGMVPVPAILKAQHDWKASGQ